MAHRISGIDHVLVAVADLPAAARAFTRLGFVPSPQGAHAEWGTANHCVMFGRDYVELIAATGVGPGASRVSDHLTRRGQGLMGVALGTDDAQASCKALRRAGVDVETPTPLSRSLQAPEGDLMPRFSVARIADGTLPGLPAFLCQHLTPDLLRRPEWLAHPNGATGLISATVIVDDPEKLMADYNRVFGPAASTPTDELITVHSGNGLIFLVTADGFADLHPDLDFPLPPAPALAVLSVGVADIDRTAAALKANGVAVERKGDHLGVDPEDALGFGLEFVAR